MYIHKVLFIFRNWGAFAWNEFQSEQICRCYASQERDADASQERDADASGTDADTSMTDAEASQERDADASGVLMMSDHMREMLTLHRQVDADYKAAQIGCWRRIPW